MSSTTTTVVVAVVVAAAAAVRSFTKMLPSVKFAEDKVLIFLILREKC